MPRDKNRSFLSWLFFKEPKPNGSEAANMSASQHVPNMPYQPQPCNGAPTPKSSIRLCIKFNDTENPVTISEFPFVIGRVKEPGTPVVIDEKSVSRRHALVECIGGEFLVSDAGSKNGVEISGRKLNMGEKFRLNRGDMFKIGRAEILVEDFYCEQEIDYSQTEWISPEVHTELIMQSQNPPFTEPQVPQQPAIYPTPVPVSPPTPPPPPPPPPEPQNICKNCGFGNKSAAKFCAKCGFNTAAPPQESTATPPAPKAFCNKCGYKNVDKENFCGGCGNKLI